MQAGEDTKTTEEVDKILMISSSIMLALYTVLFAAALHNTIRYIILEKRYQNFHIAYFYVLVILCTIVRVLWLALILRVAL